MQIQLTPESQRIVEAKIASGEFASAEEAIEHALTMWADDEGYGRWLNAAVQVGLDQLDRGEGVPLTPDVFEGVIHRGRERLRGTRAS